LHRLPKVRLELTPSCEDRILSPAPRDRQTRKNKAFSSYQRSLAPSVIHGTCQLDPHLAAVIEAWHRLPEALRAGIVAMVKAAMN
jgi:hypothetical protein